MCKDLHARDGEHRSASCHCPGKGHPRLYRPESTSKLLDPTGEEADLLYTTPPFSCSPSQLSLPFRSGGQRSPRGSLTWLSEFPWGGGAGKERKGTPISGGFLCARAGAGHIPPIHYLVKAFQQPCSVQSVLGLQMRKLWLTVVLWHGNKFQQPVCLAAFT